MVRVQDAEQRFYRAFGLASATMWQLLHPRVWGPWLRTAVFRGYGFGAPGPSWRQLTGMFVLHNGRILAAIRHQNSVARHEALALVHSLKLGATMRR